MKIEFNIEDFIIDKLFETKDEQFESYKFLKEVREFSKIFESTLNEEQKKDFTILQDIINDYETSKECEVVKLTIDAYKSLLK